MVLHHFSRDQHELLLRQLFHIRQTSFVSEYVDKFTELVDQLKAYTTTPDHLYYTTRFIDGLRDDIRLVILVARPSDLDTACTLALLQEEAVDQGHRKDFKSSGNSVFSKSANVCGKLPLPPPPPRPQQQGVAEEKRLPDERRGF